MFFCMFCGKCGHSLRDGAKFCANCGTPVEAVSDTQPPMQEKAECACVSETPVNPQIELNTYCEDAPKAPEKGKLGKKGKIALIVSAVVVAAALVAVLLNLDAIKARFARNDSPASYMQSLEQESVGKIADSVSGFYGNLLNTASGVQNAVESDIRVVLSDDIRSMLEMLMSQQGIPADLSWLEEITLKTTYQGKDGIADFSIGIGLGDVQIATLQVITDTNQQKTWVRIPELNQEYLVDDTGMLYSAQVTVGDMVIPVSQAQMMARLVESLPDEETLNNLIRKYFGIALKCLTDVEKSDHTLTLDGLEQSCTELKTVITEKTAMEIILAVLKEAKEDQDIKQIIDKFADLAASVGEIPQEYTDVVYGEFVDNIDALIKQGELALDAYSGVGSKITLYDYVDSNDKIIGRKLDLGSNEIHYYTVTQGNDFAFEAVIDTVNIIGSGTRSGNLTSGTYVLSVEGLEFFEVAVKDFGASDSENGSLNGTVRFSFGKEFADQIAAESGDPVMASLLSGSGLEFEFASEMEQSAVKIRLMVQDTMLIGLYLDGKMVDGTDIQIPTGGLDVNDELAVQTWVMNFNFNTIVENLKKTEMPEQYIAIVEEFAAIYEQQMAPLRSVA